jgi:peptidoglycan/LPS O-acetylase OafA/YrhL
MKQRLPSLDGLRAISIIMVMLGHLSGTAGLSVNLTWVVPYAQFGVRVFFVISGFLITSILIKEREKTGQISLKRFYIARMYRIFPPAYVLILVTVVLNRTSLHWGDIIRALTYTSNYHPRPWVLAHTWSLSVEEQFYLLWPAVIAFFFRYRTRLLVLTIALTPVLNATLFYFGHGAGIVGMYFPKVADSLAMGCLLAIARPWLNRYEHIICSDVFLLVPAITLALPLIPISSHSMAIVNTLALQTLEYAGIALSIDNAVRMRWNVLNIAPLRWLGVMSYSLYLWQQMFLDRHSGAVWTKFPLNIALAMLCACCSYFLVERPFLQFRDRRRSVSVEREVMASVAHPCSSGLEGALQPAICTNASLSES